MNFRITLILDVPLLYEAFLREHDVVFTQLRHLNDHVMRATLMGWSFKEVQDLLEKLRKAEIPHTWSFYILNQLLLEGYFFVQPDQLIARSWSARDLIPPDNASALQMSNFQKHKEVYFTLPELTRKHIQQAEQYKTEVLLGTTPKHEQLHDLDLPF